MWQENIGLKPLEIDPIEKCILLRGMFYKKYSEDLNVGYIYVIKVYEHKSILSWLIGPFIHDQIKGLDFKFLENYKVLMKGTMVMT